MLDLGFRPVWASSLAILKYQFIKEIMWASRQERPKVKLEKESLKKMFPNLAKEMQTSDNKVNVNSVRTDPREGEKAATYESFDNYVPDVVDFIRRCDTDEQAEEIICYLEKRGEIDKEHVQKIRMQLKQKGVRSFGTKKNHDYYLKQGNP